MFTSCSASLSGPTTSDQRWFSDLICQVLIAWAQWSHSYAWQSYHSCLTCPIFAFKVSALPKEKLAWRFCVQLYQ